MDADSRSEGMRVRGPLGKLSGVGGNGGEGDLVRFRGRVIDLTQEQVRLPNGQVAELEIIHHPGGAAVVALDDAGRVCLLRQYRYAAGGWLWELPAGKIDHEEPPLATARRELREEAGREARQWRELGYIHSSPGIFTEVIHLYLAQDLVVTPMGHELAEVIEVHWLPLAQALQRCHDGSITDSKTLVGLFRAQGILAQEAGDVGMCQAG